MVRDSLCRMVKNGEKNFWRMTKYGEKKASGSVPSLRRFSPHQRWMSSRALSATRAKCALCL